MSTALLEPEAPTRPELAEWRKQDAAIAKMADEYLPLKVNGIDDKKGLAVVHEARMVVKNTRVAVEKKRVELKADALAYGRAVDAEAKRLTGMLAPIEAHLEAEEAAVVRERERIKQAAEEARQSKIRKRLEALQSAGYQGDLMAVQTIDDATFDAVLAQATADKAERDRLAETERQKQEAETARLKQLEAEAAEKRRKEEAELAVERERLDKIRREQEAEAERLRAEQRKIEEAEAAQRRAAELEKARQEAAERARVETEQRIAREQAEAKAAAEREAARIKTEAEAEEAARLKAEAERPYREKLEALAMTVIQLPIPEGPHYAKVANLLSKAAKDIRAIAKAPIE